MTSVPIVSATVAVLAAIVSILAFLQQRRNAALAVNISLLNESLKQLGQHPELIALHNIDLLQLQKDGLSSLKNSSIILIEFMLDNLIMPR